MNLTQLKDQLFEQLKTYWTKIHESSLYQKGEERFYELSPLNQKIALFVAGIIFVLFILAIPFASFTTSQENIAAFEGNIQTVRDLLRVQRELASAPEVNDPPTPSLLQGLVQETLSQAGLASEQIQGNMELMPEHDPKTSLVPASVIEQGVEVTLVKLNLKQVVDIGTKLSQLNRNVHLTAMDMKANTSDSHYYDVIYRLVGFTIDTPTSSVEPEAPTKAPAPKKKGA
ncbi:MAG: hypothetical protein AB7F59_08245 [Bdellovibrionales bacterium]